MKEIKITSRITNRDSEAFNKYLKDINAIPMLSQKEEEAVAIRIQSEDKEVSAKAVNEMVEANLRFVVSVAKTYISSNAKLEDLVNEGNIGLITAAKRFDHTKGFKFISYAVWWVRQSIIDFKATTGTTIKLPAKRYTEIGKIKKASDALEQDLLRKPTNRELADELDIHEDKVRDLLALDDNMTNSLDRIMTEDGFTLKDTIEDESLPRADHISTENDGHDTIQQLLNILPEREKKILVLFFGIGGSAMKLNEIAEEIGLSKERVRQLKEQAIRRLKTTIKEEGLTHISDLFKK